MVLPTAHRLCRVAVACVMLAGLGLRTPGKACCGEAVAAVDQAAATSAPEQMSGTGCHYCSKRKATAPAAPDARQGASCPTGAPRDGGGGSGEKEPCERGGCAAVCCHVNAVTTAPPAVAALDAVVLEVAIADQILPARADADAIFHPPRG
jgi:hypothetical protein